MKMVVWKNKSNNQLCATIPSSSDIKEGDVVEIEKSSIRKIAYSGVVGDLFHYGHLRSIQYANSISDYNICGVFTDKAVEEYRVKPIANLKERKAIYSGLKCVDRVMVQHSRDPTDNLKRIHDEFPDAEIILIHGTDLNYVHGSEYIKSIGGRIVQHPYYGRLSTFKIINKIIENRDKFKDLTDFASLIQGKAKIDPEYERGNKTIISTKAETLKALKPLLKKSRIENILSFTVSDWKNRKEKIIKGIQQKFSGKIIVRSSAINEDSLETSMAGCFKSVLDVNPGDMKQTEKAIREVINSYRSQVSESSFNQVLVQEQTTDIAMSGVAFTRTLESNAPYYVINYDDSTGKTDTVTKGIANKTIKISRFAKQMPENMKKILEAIKEIEEKIPNIGLDIEFAINKKGEVIIFQARPLAGSIHDDEKDAEIAGRISSLKARFQELSRRKKHLCGDESIFADMPDWNPAEIIGDNPNRLDFSLYDYIITDSAWHKARSSQDYYNVDPAKLVILFGNKPYIDVRNSFNSFTPNSISQFLREKLVCFYCNKLKKNPQLQDKVEFDIVYSCYELGFDERAKELTEAGFSKQDIHKIRNSLVDLTNNLVMNSKATIRKDLDSLKEMEDNRKKIFNKYPDDVVGLLNNAKSLLDDCRDKGTVQFSRLARLAFIGKILLRSLVKKGIISNQAYDDFMNSIKTVASEINEHFRLMTAGAMSREDFLKRYAHLRPGTYDITSQRYDANPDLLKAINSKHLETKQMPFVLAGEKKIDSILKKEGLKFNSSELFEFIREALESREYAKFEFTKNLSDAIELIASAGEKMGFTRKELSLLDIDDLFFSNITNRDELTRYWQGQINKRMKEREINNRLVLPPIIFSDEDFDVINYYQPKPNYITQKKVRAEFVSPEDISRIEGRIVLIENGDPGYDWIFTRKPAGLITKYGGVASHMAIRCAEFGIPAAIGCGVLFDQLKNSDGAVLDCHMKKINMIKGDLKC